ncbi:hypothetical protein DSY14_08435 [Nocardiopsis sp. MG754419]|nr:hypothetical protein [Nocardiopsis sp. MG754419]
MLVVLCSGAPAAFAEPVPEAAERYEDAPTIAAHYADLLAERPEGATVVVDDAVGGMTAHEELADRIHAAFAPLGVPHHVVVTPFLGAGTPGGMGEVLPAVYDRLGADGLYVILPPSGGFTEIGIHGVDLSEAGARDAVREAELYGAPADEVARVMAAGLAGEEPPPTERESRPEGFLADIDPTSFNGPANLGLLVGTAGSALVIVGGWGAWLSARRGRRVLPVVTVLVSLTAAGLTVGAGHTYTMSAPTGGAEIADPEELVRLEAPYVATTDRAERLAAELAEDPLYVDPLTPLDRTGLARIPAVLDDASVPVYAAVVPLHYDDESGGDAEVLAAAVASVAERDGVYLVVGPRTDAPDVGAAVRGLRIDGFALWSPLSRNEEPTAAAALELAVADLADLEFGTGDGFEPLFADREPNLPGPRAERFAGGEGLLPGSLFLGPLLALCLIGLTHLTLFLVRQRREGGGTRTLGRRALRRLALREAERVRVLVDQEPERIPAVFMPQAEVVLMYAERDLGDLDLLGTAVLARRVCAVARDPDAGTDPCVVDPLHAFATERAHSRVGGGRVPLCSSCARLTDAERVARVLRLGSGGAGRSYRARTKDPWIRHSFGANGPKRMIALLLEENRVH